MIRARFLAGLLGLMAAMPQTAAPAPGPDALAIEDAQRLADLCDAVALHAAAEVGVPEDLMRAISLAETGRSLDGAHRPWPWTVNMEGEGRWFADPDSLLAWVEDRRAEGARSFDLGCFQVNHLWHGEAFESLSAMLDPLPNAIYAARFLKELQAETGSWEVAAGHYHSRTPDLADRYRRRVLQLRAGLGPPASPAAPARAYAAIGRNREPAGADAGRAPLDWSRRINPHGSGGVPLRLAGLAAAQGRLLGAPAAGPPGPREPSAGLLRRARPLVQAPVR